jgi:hypothetical protein
MILSSVILRQWLARVALLSLLPSAPGDFVKFVHASHVAALSTPVAHCERYPEPRDFLNAALLRKRSTYLDAAKIAQPWAMYLYIETFSRDIWSG